MLTKCATFSGCRYGLWLCCSQKEDQKVIKTHWTPLGRCKGNDYLLFTLSDISWIECRNITHYLLFTILEPRSWLAFIHLFNKWGNKYLLSIYHRAVPKRGEQCKYKPYIILKSHSMIKKPMSDENYINDIIYLKPPHSK